MASLHDAVRRGDANAVFDLLKAGHDASALDADGHPPLWYLLEPPFEHRVRERPARAGCER